MEPACILAQAAIRNDASADVVAHLVRSGGGSELAPGVPALCVAANFSSFLVVESLLAARVDVDARYKHEPFAGWSALHFACLATGAAAASTTAALLAGGASASARTANGLLPIDIAGNTNATVVTALLGAASPPRGAPGTFEKSLAACFLRALSALSDLRASCFVEAVLESGRPHDMMRWADASGRTALHLAAFAGSPALALFCIQFGADVDARDLVGASPLREAIASCLPSPPPVAKLLLDHGATPTDEDIKMAVQIGLPCLVAMLLPGAQPPTASKACRLTPNGQGLALFATRAFLLDAIQHHKALALDAAVRTGAHDLDLALAVCACLGTVEQMHILLKAGADCNARLRLGPSSIFDGSTALHCAAAAGFQSRNPGDQGPLAPVKVLVEAGADLPHWASMAMWSPPAVRS